MASADTSLLTALAHAARLAAGFVDAASTHAPSTAARREAVRMARRELKAVRALSTIATNFTGVSSDAAVEFAAKTNQILGPLRDRDALMRSIVRLSERFADGEPRRVVRAVLLATLVMGDFDREDEARYSDLAIARARKSARSCADAVARLVETPPDAVDLRRRGAGAELVLGEFVACRAELASTLASARDAAGLARLHDCRKRASFLAIALRPLGEDVARPIARLRMRAKRLASALGEDRDLALLDAEMSRARTQLAGSPLVDAIDEALHLARLEATARMEDAARAFLRVRRTPLRKSLEAIFEID